MFKYLLLLYHKTEKHSNVTAEMSLSKLGFGSDNMFNVLIQIHVIGVSRGVPL